MDTSRPHTRLLHDHEVIEQLLQSVLAAFETGDRSVATSTFDTFERRLSAHLAFEDETLLPALAAVDPRQADELAADHRNIRTRIDEIAIEDDLHVSRATEVKELAEILRSHRAREEHSLYELADRLAEEPGIADETATSWLAR